MNAFQEGLWQHLEAVPLLEPEIRDRVICYLLELACQAQNIALSMDSLVLCHPMHIKQNMTCQWKTTMVGRLQN